mmetsp:Transcript_44199/g.106958  ORF Transcript_44199/g.106958 Transcript_44199/m.106958 type:complete len:176 (-) Transcript_44199:26-553(-)
MAVFSTIAHRMLRSSYHGDGGRDHRYGHHHAGGRNCTNHTSTTGGGFNGTDDFQETETGFSFAGINSNNEFEQFDEDEDDISDALATFLVVFGTIAGFAFVFLVASKFLIPLCRKKEDQGATSPTATHGRGEPADAGQVTGALVEMDDDTAGSAYSTDEEENYASNLAAIDKRLR